MALVADNTWEITAEFGNTDLERFKFDIHGDWSNNYGDSNNDGVVERSGADIFVHGGECKITFDDRTLEYHLKEWSEGRANIVFEDIDDPTEIEGLSVK